MTEIKRVASAEDIEAVAALAHEIWNQHFVPIIGQAQVDYMLEKFQSAPAITQQIGEDGYEYYMVLADGKRAGYFALVPRPPESSAMLSKVYVRKACRGQGLGREIVAFAEARCRELGIREMWLTCNRSNTGPLAFYERMGFAKSGELVQDIGNGFVMDDFRMTKAIE